MQQTLDAMQCDAQLKGIRADVEPDFQNMMREVSSALQIVASTPSPTPRSMHTPVVALPPRDRASPHVHSADR